MFWVGPSDAPKTYQLTSRIGGGPAGEVWRGLPPLSDTGRRLVAVKISRGSGHPDEVAWWRRYGHALISLSADFRAANSALVSGVFVVDGAAAPPGDGGVWEVGGA